jgi:hypothetical protein
MIKCEPYIHSQRTTELGLKGFIENTFNCFYIELSRLRDTLYNYEEHHFIFALNERTWIGILNNAIIKAYPNSVTLQEYGVHSPTKFVGRADLLVQWNHPNGKIYYLIFEAKQYKEQSFNTLLKDDEEYLKSIKDQGQKYFDAETTYYKDKNVYVIPIVFGWIPNKMFLDKAKQYFAVKDGDKASDFCYLYHEGDSGVWVYGKIYETKIDH